MSARDRLADLIWDEGACKWRQPGPNEVADAILNAGYREPAHVITSGEELDALPEGSVVLGWSVGGKTAYLRTISGRGRLVWGCVGSSDCYESADLLIENTPATVLYVTEAGQ